MNKLHIIIVLIVIFIAIYLTKSDEKFDNDSVYQIIGINDKFNNDSSLLDNYNFDNNIVTITNQISPEVTIKNKTSLMATPPPFQIDSYNTLGNINCDSPNYDDNNRPYCTYLDKNNVLHNKVLLKLKLKNPRKIVHVDAFNVKEIVTSKSQSQQSKQTPPQQMREQSQQMREQPTPPQQMREQSQQMREQPTPPQQMREQIKPTQLPQLTQPSKLVEQDIKDLYYIQAKKSELYDKLQNDIVLLKEKTQKDIESLENLAKQFMPEIKSENKLI
jgi:hypothetical protein